MPVMRRRRFFLNGGSNNPAFRYRLTVNFRSIMRRLSQRPDPTLAQARVYFIRHFPTFANLKQEGVSGGEYLNNRVFLRDTDVVLEGAEVCLTSLKQAALNENSRLKQMFKDLKSNIDTVVGKTMFRNFRTCLVFLPFFKIKENIKKNIKKVSKNIKNLSKESGNPDNRISKAKKKSEISVCVE